MVSKGHTALVSMHTGSHSEGLTNTLSKLWAGSAVVVELARVKQEGPRADAGHVDTRALLPTTPHGGLLTSLKNTAAIQL